MSEASRPGRLGLRASEILATSAPAATGAAIAFSSDHPGCLLRRSPGLRRFRQLAAATSPQLMAYDLLCLRRVTSDAATGGGGRARAVIAPTQMVSIRQGKRED